MKKHLLALATGLLLGTTAATAQLHNWDNLPTLEEWPLEPYMREGVIIFYPLPNFELPEGKNAVAVRNIDRQWSTRYLRNPGDSANQFNWNHPGGGFIERLDINNDGFMDYLVGENIYYGRGEGLQPSPEPVRVGEHNFNGYFVDVNGDGLPDAVNRERLVIGNTDFSKNREVRILPDSVRIRNYFSTKIRYFSCWKGSDGVIRYAISYTDSVTKEPVRQSLCLYRLRVEGEVVRMELEHEIRSEGFSNLVSGVSPFLPEGANGREFVFLQRGENANRTELYAMENGKLVLKIDNLRISAAPLNSSVDSDIVKDWLSFVPDKQAFVVFSGKELPKVHPLFSLPKDGWDAFTVLGDVNNDGFNDIGYIVGAERRFHIALGRSTPTSISDVGVVRSSKLYPNPADSIISLYASLQLGGKYTILLYNISGERIAELRSGMYAEGEIVEQLDLRPLGLAPGAYILRLTGNGTFKDMKFLVPR